MSSSNQLLLSISIISSTISCAGVERADVARAEPARSPLDDPAAIAEIAQELARREAYLGAQRDGRLSVATAVLYELDERRVLPALGMAVLELNAAGLALQIAAELKQGTHHVYLLDDHKPCSVVDPEEDGIVGTPEPERPGYLGALVAVRDGPVRFQRFVADGVPLYASILGRPLVIMHAKGESVVCGVFREADAQPDRSVVTQR